MLDGAKSLTVIEYHLCALVAAEAIQFVLGPELRFQFVPVPEDTKSLFEERCR